MRTWKKHELDFLKQNYKTLDYKYIRKKLNRSIGSIYWKCFDLGLKKGRWTEKNRLTKNKVIKLLIEQSRKLNKSPSVRDIPISLRSACQKHFGNFNNAKKHAGLGIKEYYPKLKKQCYNESKELAYIAGALIGDGSFRLQKSKKRSCYVMIFATKDKDFMDFFVHNFNKWCNYKPKIKKKEGGYKKFPSGKYYNYNETYITQIPFKEAWKFLKKFKDNPIFCIKLFSDENLKWLIKGLWDAEGCVSVTKQGYMRIYFSNSDKKVIDLYKRLLKKFNFTFSLYKQGKSVNINILNEYEMLRFINLIYGITIKRKETEAIINKLRNQKISKDDENFTQAVYRLVKQIPRGRVSTYANIARALKTKAYRAVGNALRCNPYAPKVSCHRVIASDGSLGGFMGKTKGKTIEKKIRLLRKEGVKINKNKINLKRYLWK